MTTRSIQTESSVLITALGGTVTTTVDDIRLDRFNVTYTNADITSVITGLVMASTFGGTFPEGSPLNVILTTGTMRIECGRSQYVQSASKTDKIQYIVVNPGANALFLTLSTAACDALVVLAGVNVVAADFNLASATLLGGQVAFLASPSDNFKLTSLNVLGGQHSLERDCDAIDMAGGTLEVNGDSVSVSGASTVDGGITRFRRSGTFSGALTGRAGELDFTQLETPMEFSGARNLGPGVTLKYSNSNSIRPSFTGANNDVFGGPKIIYV